MKVCQVTPYFFPVLGGVETVVKEYSTHLREFGHQVTILTSKNKDRQSNTENIVEFGTLWVSKAAYFPVSWNYLMKLSKIRADVYHFHANKRFTTDAGVMWSLLNKKRFVFSPHAGQFGSTVLGKIHNKTLGKFAFMANRVICVSEYEKKLIIRNGFSEKNISILPNGVDLFEFRNAKKDFYDSVGWKKNPVIMYAGRLSAHKRLDLLIEAFRDIALEMPEVRLAIIGPDGGEGKKLLNLTRNLKIIDFVHFFGSIPRSDLVSAYTSSQIFVLPSISEAFGIVLVEAMAANTAVIGADSCSIPEIIKSQETGLLFDNTKYDLILKIKYLLKNSAQAKRLSQNAYKRVQEKYSWEIIVRNLAKIYQEIL